jgi:hypothetical protein
MCDNEEMRSDNKAGDDEYDDVCAAFCFVLRHWVGDPISRTKPCVLLCK